MSTLRAIVGHKYFLALFALGICLIHIPDFLVWYGQGGFPDALLSLLFYFGVPFVLIYCYMRIVRVKPVAHAVMTTVDLLAGAIIIVQLCSWIFVRLAMFAGYIL